MSAAKFTLKNLFAEDNGKPSLGNIGAAMIIVSTLALITFDTIKNGKLGDLTSAGVFLTGGVGATYGSKRLSQAIVDNK